MVIVDADDIAGGGQRFFHSSLDLVLRLKVLANDSAWHVHERCRGHDWAECEIRHIFDVLLRFQRKVPELVSLGVSGQR